MQSSFFGVTEIKMTYSHPIKSQNRPQITTSQQAYDILYQGWDENIGLVEEFVILLLDVSNKVIGRYRVSIGGVSSTVVDSKIIFAAALKCRASGIILAHNHPSGNLKPSEIDKQLTSRLCKAGELLDIKILDHLILSPDGSYTSFCDEGLL